MENPTVFLELQRINERPPVFSQHTTADLWTDPHISKQMLAHHLDGSVAIASHPTDFIEAAVAWLKATFHLSRGSRVVDLGCGPGLYAGRLARAGIDVTGVDFSPRSIAHAREAAARDGLRIDYVEADYLAWKPKGRFDLAMLVMRDYCALSPDRRLALLDRVRRLLAPGGAFVFDVDSTTALQGQVESASYSVSPDGGFWSPGPHFEFANTFVYPEEEVLLTRYVIVEGDRTRSICNWIQCFSPESLASELAGAGLAVECVMGDLTGRAFDPRSPQFAVVARRR
jgi:SAM-dependent methyltransferase